MGSGKIRVLQIGLSLAILLFLLYSLDFSLLTRATFTLSWSVVFLAPALLFLGMWTRSYRWQVLMNAEQGVQISGANSYKLMLVGAALNMVLPAGAGDVARSYFGYRWTGVKERMLSISLLDKLIAIASLAFMGIGSIWITGEWYFVWAMGLSILPLGGVLFFSTFRKFALVERIFIWARNKAKKIDLESVLHHMQIRNSQIIYTLFISCVGWAMSYAILYYSFEIVGLSISYWFVLAMGPLLTLARLFPLTFNGIGTDEAVIVFLFSTGEGMEGLILVAALIYRIVMTIVPAIFGLYFLAVLKRMKSKIEE